MGVTLLVDTRQQEGKHELKHEYFKAHGFRLVRTKLLVGDYQLVGGIRTVDTKMSIAELASDIDQQHDRFRGELIEAKESGYELTILVENTHGVTDLQSFALWRESEKDFRIRKNAKRKLEGSRLAKACATMARKYGAKFEFCAPDEAGARVIGILTNEGRATHDEAERSGS